MTNRGSMLRSALLLLTAILMLVGCGKTEEQKTAPAPPAPAATAPQAAAPAPQAPQAAPAPSAPAATPTAPAATVLASADGEWPNVRVEVQELKRSSGTVMLRFALINDANEVLNFRGTLQGEGDLSGENVGGVSLVDTGNKKKYLVVSDSAHKCLCSDGIPNTIAPKTRMSLWAKFPAPPDDVKKISVSIPHFAPMDDVPIGG